MKSAARAPIVWAGDCWRVPAQTTGNRYRALIGPEPPCQCDAFQPRQRSCQHIIAARLACARGHGGKAPAVVADAVAALRPGFPESLSELVAQDFHFI